MKTLAHLQEYTLTLTALSPVFVGSGDSYQKTEYLFDPSRKLVSFVDKNRFFRFLLENDLTDRYEAFILGPGNKNLSAFLKHTCRLSEEQIGSFTGKSVSAADAIDESHSLKEICQITRRKGIYTWEFCQRMSTHSSADGHAPARYNARPHGLFRQQMGRAP